MHVADGSYSNAIQGGRGACVLVHKGLVDSEVAQLVKAAAGVLRLAEGADLHKYGFRRDLRRDPGWLCGRFFGKDDR